MDLLKKCFPHAFKAVELKNLIIAVIIYIVIAFVGGLVLGFLSLIPFLGILFTILCSLLEIYSAAGILLAILFFFKVLK